VYDYVNAVVMVSLFVAVVFYYKIDCSLLVCLFCVSVGFLSLAIFYFFAREHDLSFNIFIK
jgi:hypothetical protein